MPEPVIMWTEFCNKEKMSYKTTAAMVNITTRERKIEQETVLQEIALIIIIIIITKDVPLKEKKRSTEAQNISKIQKSVVTYTNFTNNVMVKLRRKHSCLKLSSEKKYNLQVLAVWRSAVTLVVLYSINASTTFYCFLKFSARIPSQSKIINVN